MPQQQQNLFPILMVSAVFISFSLLYYAWYKSPVDSKIPRTKTKIIAEAHIERTPLAEPQIKRTFQIDIHDEYQPTIKRSQNEYDKEATPYKWKAIQPQEMKKLFKKVQKGERVTNKELERAYIELDLYGYQQYFQKSKVEMRNMQKPNELD